MKIVRTRIEFMTALQKELELQGIADKNEILSDFMQHFNDSAKLGLSEAEICSKLGDISEIARQYAEEYEPPVRNNNAVPENKNDNNTNNYEKEIANQITKEIEKEYVPELIFPDPTATYNNEQDGKKTVNPLVLNEFGDAKEIEELIKAAPLHPDAEDKSWQSEAAIHGGSVNTQNLNTQNNNSQPVQPVNEYQSNQNYQSNQPNINVNNITERINNGWNDCKKSWNTCKKNNPNINISNLIAVLCVDFFVFSWAIPALFSVVVGIAAVPISLIGSGLGMVVDGLLKAVNINTVFDFFNLNTSMFGSLSSILLGIFLACLGGLLVLVEIKLVKLCIKVVKSIINWHGKMIVGKKVFKDKNEYVKNN